MSIQTAKLIVSIIDQATGPARAINNAVGRLNRANQANAREMRKVQGQMLGAAGAAYAVATAIAKPIQASREFQDVLTDLADKGNLSAEQMDAFGNMAKRIAPDVNQFASEIVRGADFLVGMGLGLQDTAAAMPAVSRAATGTRAELTDLSMAAFAVIDNLKVPAEETAAALDAMAYAGKEGGFELRDMAKDFPTMTATMRAFGSEGVPAVADLAAALQIVRSGAGSGAEAATNMNNLLQKIAAPATVRKFAAFGVDIRQELANAIEAGVSPIEMIVEQTNKALGGDLSLLGDLFEDAQVQKALRPLIQQFDEYLDLRDRTLQNSSGTIDGSFARQMETDREIAKSAQVQMNLLAVSMGNALSPEVNRLTKLVIPMIKALTDFTTANPKLISSVASIVSGLVGLKILTLGLRWAFLFLKGGVIDFALIAVRAAGAVLWLLNPLNLIKAAIIALRFALVSTGIGAIVVALGLAGLWIYNNWEGLSAFFRGFGKTIMSALGPVMPMIQPIIDGAKQVWDALMGMAGPLDAGADTWENWGVSAANAVLNIVDQVMALPAQIGQIFTDLFGELDFETMTVGDWQGVGATIAGLIISGLDNIGRAIFEAAQASLPGAFKFAMEFVIHELPEILSWIWGIYSKIETIAFSILVGAISEIVPWLWDVWKTGVNLELSFIAGGIVGIVKWLWDWGNNVNSFLVGAAMDGSFWLLEWLQNVVMEGVSFALNIDWPKPPGWMGWLVDQGANALGFGGGGTEIDGAQADGGPVRGHGTYLVGEEGPELFTPGTSGYVHDAMSTVRMLTGSIPNIRAMPSPPSMNMASNDNAANSNGARSQVINIGDVIVSTPTNADPQQIAYALGDEIARRVGGGFSDGGV